MIKKLQILIYFITEDRSTVLSMYCKMYNTKNTELNYYIDCSQSDFAREKEAYKHVEMMYKTLLVIGV